VSKTPILDCEEPAPHVRAKSTFRYGLIGGLIGGGAIGLYLGLVGKPLPKLGVSPLRLLLGCLVAFYISILVHELGHLVVGTLLGFEFHGIGVGVFFLDKAARGFRFRVVPRRLVGGGYTSMSSRSTDNLVRRSIWLTVGGPVASMLLLVVTILLPWHFLVGWLFIVNLLLVISDWIPYVVRGQPNDAKRLLILARKGPASDRLAAIIYLVALNSRGIEPRDCPREILDKITTAADDTTFRAVALELRYLLALDSGDAETVATTLEHELAWSHEGSPEARRGEFVGAAWFQGVFRNNASLARTWLRRAYNVKGAISRKGWDNKPLAAVAFAEGKQAQARQHLQRYIDDLDRHATSGFIVSERARMMMLMNQLSAVSDR
jgi:hypothetical protein